MTNQIQLPATPTTQDHFFTDHFLMFIFVSVGTLSLSALSVGLVLGA